MISTLGASPPPNSVIREPSAGIFDIVMILSGLMIICGAYLIQKIHTKKFVIATACMGFGALGVGVFPAFHPIAHPIAALITFSAGAIAAILSAKTIRPPFSYISIALGILSLLFLCSGIFFAHMVVPILGAGGVERWVAYPIMIWLIGFGGYFMNAGSPKKSIR